MTPLAAARAALAEASADWRLILSAELFGAEVSAAMSSGLLLDHRFRLALERHLFAIADTLAAADRLASARLPRTLPAPDLPPWMNLDRVVAHLPGEGRRPGPQVEGVILGGRDAHVCIQADSGAAWWVPAANIVRNLTHDAVAYRPSDPDSEGRRSDGPDDAA